MVKNVLLVMFMLVLPVITGVIANYLYVTPWLWMILSILVGLAVFLVFSDDNESQ